MKKARIIKLLVILIINIFMVTPAIRNDIVPKVPGYGDDFQTEVYAGYLNTSSPNRKIHYVFVEAASKVNNSDPVTLWLNGGPGCSSLLGFIQQIGPYYLQQGSHYTVGDKLTPNPYSWHKLSNLLFIESPAGVGYSTNNDSAFAYNDGTTATDNMDALLNFFKNYPEYAKNDFWIAGQSYAGKYIPDLAVLIDSYNRHATAQNQKINLKGILIGNGVMNFQNGELQKSQMEFMIDHQFIDPQLIHYYQNSCKMDPLSAGCRYFNTRFYQNTEDINPYNIYSYCYYNDSFNQQTSSKFGEKQFYSQQAILKQFARKGKFEKSQNNKFNGAPCAFFDGMYQYFNAHVNQFHGLQGRKWNGPCAEDVSAKYHIDTAGSMPQYRILLSELSDYHIILYNGDWDDVVPYTDTIKNLKKLNLQQSYLYTPFFVNDQHAGFQQLYSGVGFILIKGASHQVPQSKRAQAYEMFQAIMKSHGNKNFTITDQ